MSYVATKGKFHVALNGVGLLLQGAPDRLGYQQGQAPVYGQRFASGDRDYNDLSQWWYFVQTDWSGGAKDSVSWANDAKYYYSTNIDAWSENGTIKLTREQYPAGSSGDHDFTDSISCGFEGEVNGTIYKFIGTGDSSDSRPHIYSASPGESQSFTDRSTTTIGTNQSIIAMMSARLGILWASIVGAGATWVLATWDGTTWTDQSSNLYTGASLTYQPRSSRCHCEYAGTMYVFVDNSTNDEYAMVKTTVQNPSASGNWSLGFEVTKTNGLPVACAPYNGNIYYLVNQSYYGELWAYNVAAATRTLVRKFNNASFNIWSVGDKLLVEMNGKLIITIPNNEIWELNGSTLSRIYVKDETKRNTSSPEIDSYFYWGCVIQDNKAWWGNLMYDGEHFYNTWKGDADNTSNRPYPLFADTSLRIWEGYGGDDSVLWSVNLTGGLYKGDADKNFIVFSNFDNVAGVEKLGYSVTILFKPFASSQVIKVEYLLGEWSSSASWTALGTASATIDGTTVRTKTFFFPAGTVFNKIWFRVKLEGDGNNNTPGMTDLVMEYLPMPTFKKNWTININAGDEVKRLDGRLVETTGRELKSLLEKAWWTKSVLDYQDIDYASTTLSDNPLSSSGTTITVPNGGTNDFPEQGRLRLEDEEVFYTGKTPTTFTGCTRGARGTRAVSHVLNTVINNAYKVILTDFQSRVPITLEDKELEYVLGASFREV